MEEFNIDWMRSAFFLAKQAEQEDEVPVGAVVIHNGKIIGKGYNQREKQKNPLSHAEMNALYEASQNLKSWRLENCQLIVTLEPCPMCLAACQQARIQKIVYGAQDPKGGAISLGYAIHEDSRLNHRFESHYHPMEECGKILSNFFSKKRKRSSLS